MGRLFGTDGVRGLANVELSPLLALKLGTTVAHVLVEKKGNAKILVGKDPRISGDILENALVAGICSQGIDAICAGIIPTPGVAYLVRSTSANSGAVISASHNPVEDNGIKFFGEDGFKLADDVEERVEEVIDSFDDFVKPQGKDVGRMLTRHELAWEYAEHVKKCADMPLEGMKLVVDCSNGAASELAPRILEELGAETVCENCSPNGININEDCGSLHPEKMCKLVLEHGADAGLSFDGDADRVIMADEKGNLVDGDHMMAIYALQMKSEGALSQNMVVATVMSNIGLERLLKAEDITLVRTKVGDRYVSDELRRTGAIVGGEQSGHIILTNHTTTGDGMVTGLQILSIMQKTGKKLSELSGRMEDFPQLLVNIRVKQRDGWEENKAIMQTIREVEDALGDKGRVLVRPSGTEKLIRVMAEGPNEETVEKYVHQIADVVAREMGTE